MITEVIFDAFDSPAKVLIDRFFGDAEFGCDLTSQLPLEFAAHDNLPAAGRERHHGGGQQPCLFPDADRLGDARFVRDYFQPGEIRD